MNWTGGDGDNDKYCLLACKAELFLRNVGESIADYSESHLKIV
jgi:hypothetical protein